MGRTFNDNVRKFDDDVSSGRSGKHHKHSNNRKTGGLKTLNSYVEEDYDDIDSNDDMEDDSSTDTNT
jgi:hypothetical protein